MRAPKKKSLHVLLIGNFPSASMVSKSMKSADVKITFLHDSENALSMMTTDQFDIAFMELGMPGLDGVGLARMYRSWEENYCDGVRKMPLVALTSPSAPDEVLESIAAGYDDYLRKTESAGAYEIMVKKYVEAA